jgi:hypothetical protein
MYSKCINKVYAVFKKLYDSDDSVKYFVNDVLYGIEYVNSIINWNKIEPYNSRWISVSNIDSMDSLDETYTLYRPKTDIQREYNSYLLANSLYDEIDWDSEEEYNNKIHKTLQELEFWEIKND